MSDCLTVTVPVGRDIVYPPAAHPFVLSAYTVEAVARECYLVQRKHYDDLVAERDALRGELEFINRNYADADDSTLTPKAQELAVRARIVAELDALRALLVEVRSLVPKVSSRCDMLHDRINAALKEGK